MASQPNRRSKHWGVKIAVVTDESIDQLAFFLQKNCIIPEDDLTKPITMAEAKLPIRLSLTSKKRMSWLEQRLGFMAQLTAIKPLTEAERAREDARTKQSFYWKKDLWESIVKIDEDARTAKLKAIVQAMNDKLEQRRIIKIRNALYKKPHV